MGKKIQTTNVLSTVNDIINIGRDRGVLHQRTEDETYNGRTITVNGKELINFGSCSYLGLELDQRLKDGAIEAINKYGVQFSSSRTYMSTGLYDEWESLVSKIFGDKPIALSTSVSLGHHGVIPVVIEPGDAIIMDQQVHASIQEAAGRMLTKGVTITITRHNNMDELEAKVKELSNTHNKIWYMIDGVYSMYGKFAPMDDILALLDKYKSLYLYADDAHGMSIAGKHGAGIVMNQIKELHPKMILATSLNKAFAAGGGVFVFPNEEMSHKVKNCGGSFIFSGGHQVPVIGAGIASAKIHLSDEIYELQAKLTKRLHYCHKLLEDYNLPVISNPDAPIFYVACGLTRVGYNLAARLKDEGFYVNIGVFPAVPETCSGIRFAMTNHITMEDIERLCERMAYHFPLALEEENRTLKDIYRAFRRVANFEEREVIKVEEKASAKDDLIIEEYTSIKDIDKTFWNNTMGKIGANDWDEMLFFEDTFSNEPLPESNWDFRYYIIKNKADEPLLATYFTNALTKDDAFAPASVSKQLEEQRAKGDKYYLSSMTYAMGAFLSVGQHYWIDETKTTFKDVFVKLLDSVWNDQEKDDANVLILRDFDANNNEIRDFMFDQGFVRIEIPDGHIVDTKGWDTREEFLAQLKPSRRYYVRKKVFEFEDKYEVRVVDNATPEEVQHYYNLYANVSDKNYEINGFMLHHKFFKNVCEHPNWEVLELKLKPEFDKRKDRKAVAYALSYKTKDKYNFLVTGMDYDYLEEYNIYPQILWQTILRAKELGLDTDNLGITASQNKRKFGAKVIKNAAYVQLKDSFSSLLIESMANTREIEV